MASEYLKWKYRDVKPDPKRELTPEEKRKNWWHYHYKIVIFAVVMLLLGIDLFITMTGLKEKKPDLQIALITHEAISATSIQTIESYFVENINDFNHDNAIIAKVNAYVIRNNQSTEEQYYQSYASEVLLVSDLEDCESFLFILEDPQAFQTAFEILSYTNGSLPTTFDSVEGCAISLQDVEIGTYLNTTLDAKDDLAYLSSLYIARRGFWTDKTVNNLTDCEEFWNTMIKTED